MTTYGGRLLEAVGFESGIAFAQVALLCGLGLFRRLALILSGADACI